LEDPDYLARVRAQAQVNIGKMSVDRMTADTESVYRELLGLPRLRERPSSLGG
jgi:hypothetical protein